MYKIKKIICFSAAHFLRNYKGKCENMHGHNWRVEAVISSDKLNSIGIVKDFGEIKELLSKLLDELDHKVLNDISYFREHNPSSEEIARYVFMELEKSIKKDNLMLEEVCVWETDTSSACYTKHE